MSEVMDEGSWCDRVFRDHEFSVVRLHTAADNVFRGNGFIVKRSPCRTVCDMVSCESVVGTLPVGGTMTAYFSNSVTPYNARIIRADAGRDLAWLRAQDVSELPVTCVRFFDSPFASGWNVVALAFTTLDGSSPILEPGTFSGHITNGPDEAYITCSCSSKQDASGSPVISPREDMVVGVIARASRGSVYVVPVRTIREFLGEWLGVANMNISTNGMVTLAALKQE